MKGNGHYEEESLNVVTRDPLDFRKIHDSLRPKILRYLSRMVGREEAEDLAQEVFEKVGKGMQEFRGDASVSTWIYKIATNTALDHLRAHAKPAVTEDISREYDPVSIGEIRNAPAGGIDESTEGQVIRYEMNACIREIIDRLPADYRAVILLSDLEGYQDKEIAEILGLSLRNAKVRLHRARARLREALSNGCTLYWNEKNEFACDRKELTSILPSIA
ncbi:MAG TPA: sigma-70 family RNA polymerase sigma factor [Syntrophales bacterium]|nr:sigma-70 family RNA polymerase sigma factor [Syntrophales bacterium]